MGIIEEYQHVDMLPESYWRSIILFGQNTASYKFALAKSLMELAREGKDSVTLNELAVPFSKHLCQHLLHHPKQTTSKSSQFLNTCRQFNEGTASYDKLIETTEAKGFVNVIDAFHRVNQADVPVRFYEKNYSRGSKRIILTDELFELAESSQGDNLTSEAESRWNLVETAWQMGISSHLLRIDYDDEAKILTTVDKTRRKSITSARGALNGYQKGHCFYCFTDIRIDNDSGANAEIQEQEKRFPFAMPKESHLEYAFVDLDEEENDTTSNAPTSSPQPTAKNPFSAPVESRVSIDEVPLCDVDHYFPHTLARYIPHVNFDGVWNLVLACPECNRGEGGKSARIPELKYLERLHRRNEYLINSHHPLRETIICQTGQTEQARRRFLIEMDKQAIGILVHRWSTEQQAPAIF